jgi:hypothetical protein
VNDYPFLELMWTMAVFFAWVIWFWLLILMLADIFRRRDISGWAKAGWTVLVLILPYVGVLIYMISQGRGMAERRMAESQASQYQFDEYVRSVSSSAGGGAADQIAKAKQLLDDGSISQKEYEALKQKAMTS